jgi:hypothetical protein
MNNRPKILVLGNCQARPLSSLLNDTGRFDCLPPIILHLAKIEERAEHLDRISQADIVLSQKTSAGFALPYLCSQTLKTEHPRTVVWPNVFYAGQHPFLRYMTHKTSGRLFGPLEAMHDLRIFWRWQLATGKIDRYPVAEGYAEQVAAASMIDLQDRETECDVMISDYIQGQNRDERMFFTFNHPTNKVMWHLMRRILLALGQSDDIAYDTKKHEALGRYVVPSSWTTPDTVFRGDRIAIEAATGQVIRYPGPPQTYTLEMLEAAFFETYNSNPAYRDAATIRLTPHLNLPMKEKS